MLPEDGLHRAIGENVITLCVLCEFEDGRKEEVGRDFADLGEAVRFALQLADTLGSDPGDGHGPPTMIHVISGILTELTVRVFRGGLIARKVQ